MFPFFVMTEREYDSIISDHIVEWSELADSALAEAYDVWLDKVPRLIGLIHSINTAGICICDVDVQGNGMRQIDFAIRFPRSPLFVPVNDDGFPEQTDALLRYAHWGLSDDPVVTRRPAVSVSLVLGSLMKMAQLRYKGFKNQSWGDFITEFFTRQLEMVGERVVIALTKDYSDYDPVQLASAVYKVLDAITGAMSSLMRGFRALDPSELSWIMTQGTSQPVLVTEDQDTLATSTEQPQTNTPEPVDDSQPQQRTSEPTPEEVTQMSDVPQEVSDVASSVGHQEPESAPEPVRAQDWETDHIGGVPVA